MVSRSTKKFYTVVAIVFCIFMLITFIGIRFAWSSLRPIFYGIVIAYLFKPMCNTFDHRLHKLFAKKLSPKTAKKLAYVLSIVLTYIVWLTILYILFAAIIPTVIDSVISFVAGIPDIISYLIGLANELAAENEFIADMFGGTLGELEAMLDNWYDIMMKNWQEIYEYLHPFASGVFDVVVESVVFIFNIFVGLIVSIYLLAGRKKMGAQAKLMSRSVFGKKWSAIILEETRFADKMLSGFFVGSLIDSAIVGVVCYLFCLVAKTPYPMLVSVIIAITNIIPFFGPWIGLICALPVVFTQSPLHAIPFAIFVWVLQQIDGNILAPKIRGSQTGLSSFWVLFAILFFGGLFGFVGMVIGVPVFAVIYDICGKLLRYCLERRGEKEVIEHYEKEFREEERSPLYQEIQQKFKRLTGKKSDTPRAEIQPKGFEKVEMPLPKETHNHHDDEETDREKERFNSIGTKK